MWIENVDMWITSVDSVFVKCERSGDKCEHHNRNNWKVKREIFDPGDQRILKTINSLCQG